MQDWLLQSKRTRALNASNAAASKSTAEDLDKNTVQRLSSKPEQLSKKKLSYKEQRELDQLPALISALEAEQKELQHALADGSLYSRDPARAAAMTTRASAIDEELMSALERWTHLSA
ncbi:ABC transporter ATP-binding protein uup [compost metagenome]